MKLSWAEKWTWADMNRNLNRLPFRGRLLFFGGGIFIGGGGLTGIILYSRSEDAAIPPGNEPDVLPDPPPLSGTLRRWSWWPVPRWSRVNAELVDGGLLVLGPADGKRLAGGHAGVNGSGRCALAVPLSGASIVATPDDGSSSSSSSCDILLTTANGDREALRVPNTSECQEWIDALETASTGATATQHRKRQRLIDVSFPPHWEAPWDRLRLVKLDEDSDEFRRVADLAVEQQYDGKGNSYVHGKIRVNAVSRVQSPQVWEAYCMRRSIIAAENHGDPNEKWLWHGTESIDIILKKGFDPRVCLLSGMYGGGVYFADLTTKSARYSGAENKGDKGRMFLCRVSLGRQMTKFLPAENIRRPPDPFPLLPSQTMDWVNGWKYHSLFAPGGSWLLMNEYIVYHSNQGVPEYVIDFELV